MHALVDHGTVQRATHGGLDLVALDSERVLVAKTRDECVLDRYWHRAQLVDRQHAAGCRLRGLWMGAARSPSVTSPYGEERGNGIGDGEGASRARSALNRVLLDSRLARHAANGEILVSSASGEKRWPVTLPLRLTDHGHVTISVCGLDEWAGGTRRLDMLREGLGMLADYWKIERG